MTEPENKKSKRIPPHERGFKRVSQAVHVQARLNAGIPRETDAIDVYNAYVKLGWMPRQILTEALIVFGLQENKIPPPKSDIHISREMLLNLQDAIQQIREMGNLLNEYRAGNITESEYTEKMEAYEVRFAAGANQMIGGVTDFD